MEFTVSSERICCWPRTIPFDIVGKCQECKSYRIAKRNGAYQERVLRSGARDLKSALVLYLFDDLSNDFLGHTFFKIFHTSTMAPGTMLALRHPLTSLNQLPPTPTPATTPKKKTKGTTTSVCSSIFFRTFGSIVRELNFAQTTANPISSANSAPRRSNFASSISGGYNLGSTFGQMSTQPPRRHQSRSEASDFFSPIAADYNGYG
ncbi:hypothetical protein niasHT_024741 [Heterodera trifolii]|uniref:Uncharacterized protein n=1 Tax=Heterodera trifolii TaxID=157864 RepID=A0ABD2K460_9BILA